MKHWKMRHQQTVTMLVATVLMSASLWVSVTDAKPDGVPPDACETMNPAHCRAPQSYPCPYALYSDKYNIRPNEEVVFTLEAPPGRRDKVIRGFMVQARVDNQIVIGQFLANNSEHVKVVDCCEGKQNTASHTSSDPKRKVQMRWKAPADYVGPFTFFVTVAESHDKFWVREEAKEVLILKTDSIAHDVNGTL